ncbi:RICIN domain-containing protein [Cellulomonas sp.]|uniref:RICIN domain-containing protein n=1 Tax=Cellulomonas sp. TaxID=40001 RepID=UPI001B1406A1|nr:RICIN domain-containing protein [Cellulomonas sp.]MBO9556537.1 RICIN domain-containing protein [Cellulomonas sp.]
MIHRHSTMATAREALASRLRPRAEGSDEGIALLTVVMMIMIMSALSILLLGVVTAQVKPTMFAGKNSRTVFAAEAGLDAALGQVRSALGAADASGNVYGDPHKLPCTVQGHVGGAKATTEYKVTMTYFYEDPAGKDAAWRSANKLACSTTTGLSISPSFALLSSEGLDAGVPGLATTAGDRTLETVYTFQVSNTNIDGGTIYAIGDKHCLQATSQKAGATVVYVKGAVCGSDDPRQMWTYTKDYQIMLSVTNAGGSVVPLCMTGNSDGGGNIEITLTKCVVDNHNQEFSWEGGARWRGQKADGTNYSSYCLNAGGVYDDTELVGKTLKYGTCQGDNTLYGSFDPDARVGAGPAGFDTVQIVNFFEFGRCMDVTNEKVTEPYMIVYPCKQDPSGGSKLRWNHKWKYSEPTNKKGSLGAQQIVVKNGNPDTNYGVPNADYCLTTPLDTDSSTYVTMKQCSGSNANQKWTRNAELATYAESWTFTDRYGRCITLGDKYDGKWSKMVVAKCNGLAEQKWNAPPLSQSSKLTDYKELNN